MAVTLGVMVDKRREKFEAGLEDMIRVVNLTSCCSLVCIEDLLLDKRFE